MSHCGCRGVSLPPESPRRGSVGGGKRGGCDFCCKIFAKKFGGFIKTSYLCTAVQGYILATANHYDASLAQLVEHDTLNVGVLGSSPRGSTSKRRLFRSSLFLRVCATPGAVPPAFLLRSVPPASGHTAPGRADASRSFPRDFAPQNFPLSYRDSVSQNFPSPPRDSVSQNFLSPPRDFVLQNFPPSTKGFCPAKFSFSSTGFCPAKISSPLHRIFSCRKFPLCQEIPFRRPPPRNLARRAVSNPVNRIGLRHSLRFFFACPAIHGFVPAVSVGGTCERVCLCAAAIPQFPASCCIFLPGKMQPSLLLPSLIIIFVGRLTF